MNTADELQKLYALHQAGALSDEEYAEAKAKLLAGSLSHPAATTPERQAMKTPDQGSTAYTADADKQRRAIIAGLVTTPTGLGSPTVSKATLG